MVLPMFGAIVGIPVAVIACYFLAWVASAPPSSTDGGAGRAAEGTSPG